MGGIWQPNHRGVDKPHGDVVEPYEVVAAEVRAFLDSVDCNRPPIAGVDECGVGMARVLEAVHRSSTDKKRVLL